MSSDLPLQGRRILVIEDDYYLATDEGAALLEAGATVVACTGDPVEAQSLIETGSIDVALVDINLGDGPAFDLADCLRDRRIPFLFTTGYDARSIPAGFANIQLLEKPFTTKTLINAVARILSAPR